MELKGILGRRVVKENVSGYAFMLPTLAVIGTFVVAPILFAFFLSFNKVQLLGGMSFDFVGLKHFERMLDDSKVWIALKNTARYVMIVVPAQTFLALILASALNAQIRGRNLFRIVYFMPTVTSSAVLTLIFIWIYNPTGILNTFLEFIGIPTYNWLADPAVALISIMMLNIYSTAPQYMVVYLASMQDISASLYEAAEIDGAGTWTKFWRITVPLLKPVTFFVVIVGIIGSFQVFDQAYIISRGDGGPSNSTLTIVLLIYRYAFRSLDMGYAAALAFLLAAIILLLTIVQRKIFGEDKN